MFTKVISIIWIILGIFWLVNPAALARHLEKKALKRMRKLFLVFTFGVSFYFFGLIFKVEMLIARVVLLCLGLFFIFKGISFLKAQAYDNFSLYFSKLSLRAFRIYAAVFTGIGIILYFLR